MAQKLYLKQPRNTMYCSCVAWVNAAIYHGDNTEWHIDGLLFNTLVKVSGAQNGAAIHHSEGMAFVGVRPLGKRSGVTREWVDEQLLKNRPVRVSISVPDIANLHAALIVDNKDGQYHVVNSLHKTGDMFSWDELEKFFTPSDWYVARNSFYTLELTK